MLDIDSLERSLKISALDDGVILDASDFARLRKLSLNTLNGLILEVSHEMYSTEANQAKAIASVVSLINLGYLSPTVIYENKQYA